MRLCSSARAYRSLSTTMVSKSAISRTNEPVLASIHRDSRKYERTRLRSDPALPTYNTAPAASLNKYTPALSGSALAFSRGSIKRRSDFGSQGSDFHATSILLERIRQRREAGAHERNERRPLR